MSRAGRAPVRTCIGCRTRAEKDELLRVVLDGAGSFAPDPDGRAPGRGAYLHRDPACVEAATRRGALARALRAGAQTGGAARLLEVVRAASPAEPNRPSDT